MTADELERIAKFVRALNALEEEHQVSFDQAGNYDATYLEIVPHKSEKPWGVVPYVGGDHLIVERLG